MHNNNNRRIWTTSKKNNFQIYILFNDSQNVINNCWARPRNNGLFPNSGPSEERHVQRENTYEALLNPNKRQGNLSEE